MATKPTNENLLQRLTRENRERRLEIHRAHRTHWQIFNIGARIVGVCFTLAGFVISVFGIIQLLDVNAVPTSELWMKATNLIVGLVIFSLGILLVLARRYRPDLGD